MYKRQEQKIAEAQQEAQQIVSDYQAQADKIMQDAQAQAQNCLLYTSCFQKSTWIGFVYYNF